MRLAWQQLYAQAVAGSVTFLSKLEALRESIYDEVSSGQAVSSTSGSSGGTQWATAFFKGAEPQDRAALILELIDVYTEASANLVEQGIAAPTDLQIRNEGDAYLKADASSYICDFSQLR